MLHLKNLETIKYKLVASGILRIDDFKKISVSEMFNIYREKHNQDLMNIINNAIGHSASQTPKLFNTILKQIDKGGTTDG